MDLQETSVNEQDNNLYKDKAPPLIGAPPSLGVMNNTGSPDLLAPHTLGQYKNESPSGFLEDEYGNKSSIRLLSIIALIAAMVFGYLTISQKDSSDNGLFITFGFLGFAFVPKVAQKWIEGKLSQNNK